MNSAQLDLERLRTTLIMLLDHACPVLEQHPYRLVGTAAALLQGVLLPARDINILVRERPAVDAIGAALAAFRCLDPPAYLPEARQYYANYEVNGVEVGISTVEWETDSDAIECLGRGPWEHYHEIPCGPHTIPVVALELRLVSELARERPDRYRPLIQHMQAHGCDVALVRRGLEARGSTAARQREVQRQLRPSLEQLQAFVVRAKAATYVGGGEPSPACRPGSHDLRFEEGAFSYLDSYFGEADFIGQEVVFHHGRLVWAMNYYGRILEPTRIAAAEAGQIIRESLSCLYRQDRFLGGFEHTTSGGDTYVDTSQGDIASFSGREWIIRGGARGTNSTAMVD